MSHITMDTGIGPGTGPKPNLQQESGIITSLLFFGVLLAGLSYTAYSIYVDVAATGAPVKNLLPFLLLGVALIVALGFEFVNGFHDTANAVATVIYTHSLPANVAVVWSGVFNLLGVLFSTGAVAFGIISLLPVELILQVGSSAGFAMVFALLIAAIIWNLGTWYLGLPASSSHTLIGSIIGVGVANAMMRGMSGTAGVDWAKATEIAQSLLISPLIGFAAAVALFFVMRFVVRNPALYKEPEGNQPPPLWIRGLLVLTCTGVSFAHGSNDGQKGMGLIMLILIGTVPTAYALNRTMPDASMADFVRSSQAIVQILDTRAQGHTVPDDQARKTLSDFVSTKKADANTAPALESLAKQITAQVSQYGSINKLPLDTVGNTRNDMYLASESLRFLLKDKAQNFSAADVTAMNGYKKSLDAATKFIPTWVKVAVAVALGLGTMVGWRRIVVTVGEKIGKTHMTYAQGASAEIVAATTIFAADSLGLPVSTTHVLSSGVAGAMAANGSGLQWATIRNMLMAWVLTLPAAICLSATLYFIFSKIF